MAAAAAGWLAAAAAAVVGGVARACRWAWPAGEPADAVSVGTPRAGGADGRAARQQGHAAAVASTQREPRRRVQEGVRDA